MPDGVYGELAFCVGFWMETDSPGQLRWVELAEALRKAKADKLRAARKTFKQKCKKGTEAEKEQWLADWDRQYGTTDKLLLISPDDDWKNISYQIENQA